MSRTSTALKRLGVAGVAAATIGAGAPAFFATGASAAAGETLTITPVSSTSAPAGTCILYKATYTPVDANTPRSIKVTITPRSAQQDSDFCSIDANNNAVYDSTAQSDTNDSGGAIVDGAQQQPDTATFVDGSGGTADGSVIFGVISDEVGTTDIAASLIDSTIQTTDDATAASTATFTAGFDAAAASVAATPDQAYNFEGGTQRFTVVVKDANGKPLPQTTVDYYISSGPDAGDTGSCNTVTDQSGSTACDISNTANQFGTDTVVFFVDKNGNAATSTPAGSPDTGDPRDTSTVTFQEPQPTGTTLTFTCGTAANRLEKGTAADTDYTCQNPLTSKTETFTATVKNAAGTVQSGVAVQFALTDNTSGTDASIDKVSCLTDASGQCTVTVTNPTPAEGDNVEVDATINTATGLDTVTDTKQWHNPAVGEQRNISLTPETATQTVGGVQALTATVTDRFGNPVKGVDVTFTETGTGRFTDGNSTKTVKTGADGTATVEVTTQSNEAAGTETVTATLPDTGTGTDECDQAANKTLFDSSNNNTAPTTNYTNAGAGNCSDSSTVNYVSASSPSPSPSSTGTVSPPASAKPTLSTSTPDIQPNQQGKLTAKGITANAVYELRCYSRPSTTYFTARTVTAGASDTQIDFTILPGTNTRCYVRPQGNEANASNSVVINVHTTLSLSAYRDGTRQYHFQGTNLPRRAGQLITLYRWARADNNGYCDPKVAANDYTATSSDPNCIAIRTATAKTDSSNVWRIDRTFTGSGQFVFMAKTSANLTNAAGVSNLRLTIIH